MNEDTNSDLFKEAIKKKTSPRLTEDMKPTFKKYQSTSRTLVRGAWFFDFTRYLFRTYVDDRNITMADLARVSYDESGLSARHSWFL